MLTYHILAERGLAMKDKEYLSIQELATKLGVSRIAVYKKVKSGKIAAIRIGRNYAIPVEDITGEKVGKKGEQLIDGVIKKTLANYSETLKLLGKE
jgi:excisionase family DNA binding protein